jgi:phosphoribosylamine--glycine ligase
VQGDRDGRGKSARGQRALIVGSGAREHALASSFATSGHEVVCAPGNPGTDVIGRNVAIDVEDSEALVDLAVKDEIDLVVVGPEGPLSKGLVDALTAKGVAAFGPTRAAARLEASKAFMKHFCKRHDIRTAPFEVFDDAAAAERYVRACARSMVVKADGLARGKGVVVADTVDDACIAIDRFLRKEELGEAGSTIVIEERLPGEEASFHVVCDGQRAVPLVAAQDHKRVADGDRGPNTGGMGAYAPAPIVTPAVQARVLRDIVEPTLAGMAAEGAPFCGVLFVGLMIDKGEPTVVEFNVRLGDPEATVLLPMYDGDFFALAQAASRGDVSRVRPRTAPGAALSVVMAAAGYPGKTRGGDRIDGVGAALPPGAYVLHAGTARTEDGLLVTSGGRVLTVGARAPTLQQAARVAYDIVARIRWSGEHHRSDIGARALSRRSNDFNQSDGHG